MSRVKLKSASLLPSFLSVSKWGKTFGGMRQGEYKDSEQYGQQRSLSGTSPCIIGEGPASFWGQW